MLTVPTLAGFTGRLIGRDDSDYDSARRIWNDAIDRRPLLIAQCADSDDAARALAFSRKEGFPITVRGGGHNVAGSALCDDGIVVDFSALRKAEVDPRVRVARVQPGALWGDLDTATQAHGLATPAGIVTHTGVAGLTVGGGFGWLSRRWGLSSDNLVGAQVLLADGTRLHASADQNSDLFWAISGGGGNFGIVTEFEFALHPLGQEVLAGPLLYRPDQAREVLAFYREFIASAPDELAVYLNLRTAPPFDWVPPDLRGANVLMVIPFYSGDLGAGEAILAPLRRFGPPAADLVRRQPYLTHQGFFDASVPHHWGYYWKSHYLPPLSDGAIDVLLSRAWQKTSPSSYTLLFHMGGAIARRPADFSAAGGRDAAHAMNINAAWSEGGPHHPDISWCREFFGAMEPHATGSVYVNFLHNDEGEARIRAAYGDRYNRLARIKAHYDPDNVFRSNQNIKPDRDVAERGPR
ncbi:MAG TPA: FAD-binding oxidoreductase [Candidatus Acidoferrum sp.]|nr:FAD-binding oxidoreductase [Candidatus Acidoferrum sp.]